MFWFEANLNIKWCSFGISLSSNSHWGMSDAFFVYVHSKKGDICRGDDTCSCETQQKVVTTWKIHNWHRWLYPIRNLLRIVSL